MAFARVQATGKVKVTSVASVALTFATPPTVGNGVVVIVSFKYSTTTTLTCVDNRGNTYTLAKGENGTGPNRVAIFACAIITTSGSPFTVTVSFASSTGSFIASAVEVSGVGTGLVADAVISGTAVSGTAVSSGTAAALTATEAFLAGAMSTNAAQASITVGVVSPVWTEEYEDLAGGISAATGEGDSRIVTSALGTTPSISWTQASSTAWTAALVAFKAGGAAAVPTAQPYVWGPL